MPSRSIQTGTVATSAAARAHFSQKLRFETDCADVHGALEAGNPDFVLLDVRSPKLFAAGHIPHARHCPRDQISRGDLPALPEGAIYVVYCAGPHCNGATKAALELATAELPVKEMIGGIEGWKDEGYDLVTE